MPANLRHEIRFTAAYDKRPEYGQHCVDILFLVHGEKGTIQFVLYTGWYPNVIPTPDKDWQELNINYEAKESPMPADIGYHSYVPKYEDQTVCNESCQYLGGKPCYYDGSDLNAYRFFSILVHQGDEALWAALDAEYELRLGDKELENAS